MRVALLMLVACGGSSSTATDAPPDAAPVHFAPQVTYSIGAGSGPSYAALADLDRDNDLDLVIAANASQQIAILLNDGHGVFGAPTLVASTSFPSSTPVGDLNHDGWPDFVDNYNVYLNQHDGTFTRTTSGTIAAELILFDYDGDGALDIIAEQPGNGALHIAHGNGNGTFAAPMDYSITPGGAELGMTDVDGDGRKDILVTIAGNAQPDHVIEVHLASGAPHATIDAGFSQPIGIAAGDLNGDQHDDLVVTSAHDASFAVLDGASNFSAPALHAAGTRGPCEASILGLADMNGDGHLDLALPCYFDANLMFFAGIGDGTFQDPVVLPVGTGPHAVAVGDLDGDGRADLVTANQQSDDISVLLRAP